MLKYFFELRNKFVLIIVTFFSTLLICYWYKDVLLFLVTQMHLNDDNFYFIFTDIMELFYVYFRVIFFFSVQIIIWHLFYHTFFFLSTALYLEEFNFLSFFFKSGTGFLFFAGFLSSYVLIPFSWIFFSSFHFQQGFYFEAHINEYLDFYINVYIILIKNKR